MDFPLSISTVIDCQRQRQFLRYLLLRNSFLWFVVVLIMLCLLIIAALASPEKRLLSLVLATLFPLLVFLTGELMIWQRSRLLQDFKQEFYFTEKGVEVRTISGIQRVCYANIFRIYETKKDIYLMLSKQSGWVLKKSDCPERVLALIQDQMARDK
ncbi:YcxB family protein [Streptococcus ovuberis]|uniref:YcxB family protein n=1 Tax=Streptococcus ovuberis TaxID=1936207 RepID=A0A7X6MWN0_9STRE|nr:YcxB family protein [Streptococcus ovuberis]NKZ19750.1 YcxB family protein [Streptococcus ovuberis]